MIRVRIFDQRFQRVERGNACLAVDGWFGCTRLEELATVGQEHKVEGLSDVPASLHVHDDGIFHDAGLADRLGCRKHLVIGSRNVVDPGLGQNVGARKQVLRVGHERNRHNVAINGNLQVVRDILAVLLNEIVQRTHQPVIHQLGQRGVGDDDAGVFCWVRRQRSIHDLARLGCVIARKLRCARCTVLLGCSGDGMNGREIAGQNANGLAVGPAGRVTISKGRRTHQRRHRARHDQLFDIHVLSPYQMGAFSKSAPGVSALAVFESRFRFRCALRFRHRTDGIGPWARRSRLCHRSLRDTLCRL